MTLLLPPYDSGPPAVYPCGLRPHKLTLSVGVSARGCHGYRLSLDCEGQLSRSEFGPIKDCSWPKAPVCPTNPSYVGRAARWRSCSMQAAGFLALRTHFDVAEESGRLAHA